MAGRILAKVVENGDSISYTESMERHFFCVLLNPDGVFLVRTLKSPLMEVMRLERLTNQPYKLVYEEGFPSPNLAQTCYAKFKKSSRRRRMNLILKANPELVDLLPRRTVLYGNGDDDFGMSGPGVRCTRPIGPPPRQGANEEPWPEKGSEALGFNFAST